MDREVTDVRDRNIPVEGGDLHVAEYGPVDGPVVLAVHGITASSRAWPGLARLVPAARIVAPDLRGRARSNALPAPFGLQQHAEDLRRLLDDLGRERVVVAGHSMGAFVAALLAAAEPSRVQELVLIDGGFPLATPPGVDLERLLALSPEALLGPAWERLSKVFPFREDYEVFWKGHPAFAGSWNDDIAAYADYDLESVDKGFTPSANREAVAVDQKELFGSDAYRRALTSIRQPTTVLRAPLGLQAEPPGLYAPGVLNGFTSLVPQLEVVEVPEVNHYTIVMTRPGVDRVADVVSAAVARLH